MSIAYETKDIRTISWGSIITGIVTVMATSILLSTLGSSLGFAMVEPTSDDPVNGAGMAVGLWTAFSIVISLFAGSFIAGRLAGYDGMIHGFLNWASALLVASVLGAMLVSSSIKTAGNALGSIALATGSMISSGGEALGNGLSRVGDAGQHLFEEIVLDTHLSNDGLQSEVENALVKSGIPTLQPDYLKRQLQGAKDDIMLVAHRMAVGTESSEQVAAELTEKLAQRSKTITANINRDDIKHALTQNTDLTPVEADRMVENILNTRDRMVQEVSKRLTEAQTSIQQAQQRYDSWKKQAAEKAEQMSKAATKAALWSFFALLIGAVISTLAGFWGTKSKRHVTKSKRHV
ncbi:MAG: CAP-Gly protein [Symbiopectobacterium sp.]|uniref:CAP-Gly protein n=1 Tax=Symbiopectobacterium sp. TaxID=2952789 RepID=UPI0039E732A8